MRMVIVNLNRREKVDHLRYWDRSISGQNTANADGDLPRGGASTDMFCWCLLDWQGDRVVELFDPAWDQSAVDVSNGLNAHAGPDLSMEETRQIEEQLHEFRDVTDLVFHRLTRAQQLATAEDSLTPEYGQGDAAAPPVDLIDRLYSHSHRRDHIERLYHLWQTHSETNS